MKVLPLGLIFFVASFNLTILQVGCLAAQGSACMRSASQRVLQLL
jgi:hypothetical protein